MSREKGGEGEISLHISQIWWENNRWIWLQGMKLPRKRTGVRSIHQIAVILFRKTKLFIFVLFPHSPPLFFAYTPACPLHESGYICGKHTHSHTQQCVWAKIRCLLERQRTQSGLSFNGWENSEAGVSESASPSPSPRLSLLLCAAGRRQSSHQQSSRIISSTPLPLSFISLFICLSIKF